MVEWTEDSLLFEDLRAPLRSLRMAVVTETYPPEVNGVAMSISRVVDGLHARGHDIQLVRPRRPGGEGATQAPFAEVLTGSWPVPRYPNLRMGVPSKRALVKRWAHQRPDVVHVATEGPLGWSALQAALHLQICVSTDFRTNFHAYGQHYGAGWLARPIWAYLRKFHNRADCTMVPTDALRLQLTEGGFERVHVVGRGVDTALYDPVRRSAALRATWGVDDDAVAVLYVGRLAAEKNLEVLQLWQHTAKTSAVRTKLVFVGDGPLRAALQQACPDAVFAGYRSGEDLAAHYASADVFAFPSLTETYGNVTAEAMASGLPVVAFDCAAAQQLFTDGDNGLLARSLEADDFLRTLQQAVEQADLRRQCGARARVTALALGWDQVVARFEWVLKTLVSRESPGGSPPNR